MMALLKNFTLSFCLASLVSVLHGQAAPTATRGVDIQVGVAASAYTLDFTSGYADGLAIYGDVDFRKHLGVEALYRNASIQTPHDVGENHLLVGPRYHIDRGRFSPYAKGLVGSGTINYQLGYPAGVSSQSYFIYALGGGVDLHATRHINVRLIDFEYQIWPGFLPHGLTPYGYSAGAAYHF